MRLTLLRFAYIYARSDKVALKFVKIKYVYLHIVHMFFVDSEETSAHNRAACDQADLTVHSGLLHINQCRTVTDEETFCEDGSYASMPTADCDLTYFTSI